MENMPYRDDPEAVMVGAHPMVQAIEQVATANWRDGLPLLSGQQVVLRELRQSDAAPLFKLLTAPEVARFISPPPSSIEGFERFISWTIRQRVLGTYVCFAVTLPRTDVAIGLVQVRQLDSDFSVAEWGFAIGSPFWGSGAFEESAELALEFVFDTLGVRRLEARAATVNGRGNRALQKIGACEEAVLRKSFRYNGQYVDQILYTILDDDWRLAHAAPHPRRRATVLQPAWVH
jgi:RimJ/RimL family protein N-acetyltransferase